MKKCIAMMLALALTLSMAACGGKEEPTAAPAASEAGDEKPEEASGAETEEAQEPAAEGEVYRVGVAQLVQHEALDAATQGFKDALKEALGDQVTFEEQNASNDIPRFDHTGGSGCKNIKTGFPSFGKWLPEN